MKLHRIYAVLLRYLFLFRHSYDRLSDAFYWPTIDLLLWGLTSSYISQFTDNAPQFVMVVISGILFWIITWRGQYEITVNLLEDLWNKNLVNMFVAPLKFSEWITSFIILGIIKAFFSFLFAVLMAFLLYKIYMFSFGFYLIPISFMLIMSGWWVGFLVAGIILRFGSRVQTLAWVSIFILSPFSAIYYPVSILPAWAQAVSKFIPMSYIFEGAREVIYKGYLDPGKVIYSFILNCIYLFFAVWFLKRSFKAVLNKGLVKVF